jgi:Leucine-rich repeat (LRR) protein
MVTHIPAPKPAEPTPAPKQAEPTPAPEEKPVAMENVPLKPATKDVMEEALRNLARENRGLDRTKCTYTIEGDRIKLRLDSPGLTNIRALTRLPLSGLTINEGNVWDLRPLHGMPLDMLGLHGANSDLKVLAGMKISSLNWSGDQIHDLSSLTNVTMKHLTLQDTSVTNLNPLSAMASITQLYISHNKGISDLSPLSRLPLTALWMDNTVVKDLNPLVNIAPLSTLHISDCPIRDLTCLARMGHLNDLQVDPTQLQRLKGAPRLTVKRLTIEGDGRIDGKDAQWLRDVFPDVEELQIHIDTSVPELIKAFPSLKLVSLPADPYHFLPVEEAMKKYRPKK